ncbi:hypothetical protein SCG7086_DG_00030 [Chlamydiales bacterium SCGC AG-110-P3]|nr:hypothetical protein SCG7086_BJ_00020 [Chlamydiales bacterium SCGC AG-110-P3]SCA63947.1 hypothetical protein SCG7086_BJ_00220 [Chlamydiales bacterium SCGC AG-110-P3]SCA64270.1 hypothetical protein SCG7086_DG_00030 [Chlamydiales bacterium SCGC AG-110-P3]
MNPLTGENITGKVLDHLGLISSVIEEIGLIEKVDTLLPLEACKGVKVTMGQRVAAMILNGLGFMNDRLYLFEKFLENNPVDQLFGEAALYWTIFHMPPQRIVDSIFCFLFFFPPLRSSSRTVSEISKTHKSIHLCRESTIFARPLRIMVNPRLKNEVLRRP